MSADEVAEGVGNMALGGEELPDDIRALIEETVEDKAEQEAKKTAVTTDMLIKFFEQAVDALESEELNKEVDSKLAEEAAEGEKQNQKLATIKSGIEKAFNTIWENMNVDISLGKRAMNNLHQLLQSDKLDEKEKEGLSDIVQKFGLTEHRFVGSKLLGEEEYERRQKENRSVQEEFMKLTEQLTTLGPKERGELIQSLKAKGEAFKKKLSDMGQEKAVEYMDNMTEEDTKLVHKLSALTRIIQAQQGGQAHGHSHNGKPCGGHGHSHNPPPPQQSHGHSHNGKPCGGHGHSQPPPPQQSHGHSHNGKPCGGHGHSH